MQLVKVLIICIDQHIFFDIANGHLYYRWRRLARDLITNADPIE